MASRSPAPATVHRRLQRDRCPSPVGQVVINEIMYNPACANAQYVELYNTSTNVTFDLSGWQLQGLAYTFPRAPCLGRTVFWCWRPSRAAFAAAYGRDQSRL